MPDCCGNTFVPLPEHVGCLVRVDCTASAFVHGTKKTHQASIHSITYLTDFLSGKLYNLSAFALFPPISSGIPVVASISWTGQFRVGGTVSVDVTIHDASHALSKIRMGWAHPGDSNSVSWIDAPAPLDAVPVITVTRRDVGSVLVCEVLPVGSAGQEGQRMLSESQLVQDDAPLSPVLTSRPSAFASVSNGATSLSHIPTHDGRSSSAQASSTLARGLQLRETRIPQSQLPQHVQSSDDRPSMIQGVSVMGDGVVGCLMRSHVSFPNHERTSASAV